MSTYTSKVRENRCRRMAARRGLAVRKNPRRDPWASDFGSYMLVDPYANTLVADFGWDCPSFRDHLADLENWLDSDHRPQLEEAS